MSLFSALLRNTSHPGDGSHDANLLPWHAFNAAIDHSLRMLRGLHIPVSLFAVRTAGRPTAEAADVIGEALSQFGSVGRLADSSIGLLYLGPRSPETGGDDALANHIFRRVERRLHERGWSGVCGGLELSAVHRWTDHVSGAAELMRALDFRRVSDRHNGAEVRTYRPN